MRPLGGLEPASVQSVDIRYKYTNIRSISRFPDEKRFVLANETRFPKVLHIVV